MKIVICSLGGTVGKTTITAHLLCPRLPKARVSAVDTANMTVKDFGIDCDIYPGEQFSKLYKELIRQPHAIIDVGGSKEGKEFLEGMDWLQGHDEIDAFIIPSVPDDKSQKASYKTIELLLAQGVEKEKIKVIFNRVAKNTEEEFDYLLGALTVTGIPYSLDASVFNHDVYRILSENQIGLAHLLKDKANYKALFREADPKTMDEQELSRLGELAVAQKFAPQVNKNLDKVFSVLFPELTASAPEAKAEAKAESKRVSEKA